MASIVWDVALIFLQARTPADGIFGNDRYVPTHVSACLLHNRRWRQYGGVATPLPLTAPPIVNVEAGVSHVRSVDPLTAIDERKAGEMVVDSATSIRTGGGYAAAQSCGSGDEPVPHLAQVLDLGLHDIARREKGVRALADTAAGAAAENVAGLDCENVRGVFDLLLGREDELRGVAILLDVAVDREADEQIHMVRHEGTRY